MKLEKIITDLFLNMDCPSWFKEHIVRDFSDLEAQISHIEILYGVRLRIEVEEIKKEKGRWLGKGIVEQMVTMADLYKKQ